MTIENRPLTREQYINRMRFEKAISITDEFRTYSQTVGPAIKDAHEQAHALRKQADALEAAAKQQHEDAVANWDKILEERQFPVFHQTADLTVVPWLKHISPDQIMLGIGDGEWVVCSAPDYILHHYSAPTESGHATCQTCKKAHIAKLPAYNLAVLGDFPASEVVSNQEATGESVSNQA